LHHELRRLARYGPDDFADLFDAFSITVTYDNQPTRWNS
jgi:hypothetical protein